MEETKTFYFFIENEFICKPKVNLRKETISTYSLLAITVNLVEFTFNGELKKKVYKIYSDYTPNGYDENKMTILYKGAKNYIQNNFIKGDPNKIFLGCVRDDSGTHENVTTDELKFDCRTDPIHDIFNILKNIYLNFMVIYDNTEYTRLEDINELLKILRKNKISLPNVGYSSNLPNEEEDGVIWIPSKKDAQLEKYMMPLRELFENNYYEFLLDNVEKYKKVESLLKFIILLKKIYNFQIETIDKKIKDKDITVYENFYNRLKKYKFYNGDLRCLNSLKNTMELNIKFLKEHKISIVPILFSTQMIEAEKGLLRYNNFNSAPSKAMCDQWFEDTKETIEPINASSEFGQYELEFEALPDGLERMNIDDFGLTNQMEKLTIEETKTFYYFIENEFICRPDRDLLTEEILEDQNYFSHAITVNLMELTAKDEPKTGPKVYKIYLNFSETGLKADDMTEFYKQISAYVKTSFIGDDENKIFLGCIRDDNNTHKNLIFENLGFYNGTDPVHDIFNVLKNIYNASNRLFNNENPKFKNMAVNLGDLIDCLSMLGQSNSNIKKLRMVDCFDKKTSSAEYNARNIWIPDEEHKLEAFIEPFKHLFSINYYEKLLEEIGEQKKNYFRAAYLLNFIILLKNLLNFQNEVISNENIGKYEDYLLKLSKFDFDNRNRVQRITCLNSLKTTIAANIQFFKDHKTSFKPIWFSTQIIEAEKGILRYQSCNAAPTENQCTEWFEKAVRGEIDEVCYSEFGRCHVKFTPVPIEPMITVGIKAFGDVDENPQNNVDMEA